MRPAPRTRAAKTSTWSWIWQPPGRRTSVWIWPRARATPRFVSPRIGHNLPVPNDSNYDGAVFLYQCPTLFQGCTFWENSAVELGGADGDLVGPDFRESLDKSADLRPAVTVMTVHRHIQPLELDGSTDVIHVGSV